MEKLRKFSAWEYGKNKKFFEAEIRIFKEVLSLSPKNHILIKKEECNKCYLLGIISPQDACRLDTELVVVHSGQCKADSVCERLTCSSLAMCGQSESSSLSCVCVPCPPVYTPVCSVTNVTHNSKYHLLRP